MAEVVVGALISAAAPAIGSAIGGVAATAVGKAFIGVGLSIGASYLMDRSEPQKSLGSRGRQLSVRYETNEPREFAFGTCMSEGSLKYHNVYGPNGNDYVQYVFVLADHECDGLEAVYVNGKEVTLEPSETLTWVSGQPVTEYSGAMWIAFHNGAWGQSADGDLDARSSGWTSDHVGRGVCYVRVTLKYDEVKFPQDPSFRFKFRGAKLYDWRKDSTAGGDGSHVWGDETTYEWSDNPVVIWYNYRRGVFVNGHRLVGMNTSADQMPLSHWTAAANACDEGVNLKAGGTEKRYRANGIIESALDHESFKSDILATMAGEEVNSGGIIRVFPGVSQASVMAITDEDLMASAEFMYTPRLSRTSLVNSVFGTFADPAQLYEPNSLPPRISPDDEASDGGNELTAHFDLKFITSGTQGQRVLEILRRRGRYQRAVTLTLRSRFCLLEAGDWVTWTSDRYGWTGMKFEVLRSALERDLTVTVELREISESIYAWTAGSDELDPVNPKEVEAGAPSFTTVQNLTASSTTVNGANGTQFPGLHATWDEIDDATVSAVVIEYRKVGDTAALVHRAIDPSAGQAAWVEGVVGGVEYEIRAMPETSPLRTVTWTGWVSTTSSTDTVVVGIAASANSVPPDTITPEMLDEQSRFELSLITALAEIQGSAAGLKEELNAKIIAISEALAETQRRAMEQGAFVRTQEIIRQTDTESFAQQLTEVGAALDGKASASALSNLEAQVTDPGTGLPSKASAAAVTALGAALDGKASAEAFLDLVAAVETVSEDLTEARARATIGVNVDNQIIGLIDIAGNLLESVVTILADKFLVAKPDGTGATQILTVGTTPLGASRVGISGDVIINGTISALALQVSELSAIVANLGVITAGRLQSADGSCYFDLDEKDFQMDF
jgi:hypothetical protein